MRSVARWAAAAVTGVTVYFADPHSPWQRGSNENTNGLLRHYLPKGTDLSGLTQQELDAIAWKLNTRPRKLHGFRSPIEVYDDHLAKVRFFMEELRSRRRCRWPSSRPISRVTTASFATRWLRCRRP
jgi:hypothetical protein